MPLFVTIFTLALLGAYLLILRRNRALNKALLRRLACMTAGAVVCGTIWSVALIPILGPLDGSNGPGWTLEGLAAYNLRCIPAALIAGWMFRNEWLKPTPWYRTLILAIPHEILGAALFGTFLIPGAGTFGGLLYAFPLMPVQIFGSLAQILLYRRLAGRCNLLPNP